MWDVYDVALSVLPVAAVIAWIVYVVVSVTMSEKRGCVEAIGWAASVLTALAVLPYFSIVIGFLLFLPAMWFERAEARGAVYFVAWAEVLVLSAAVLTMGRWAFRSFGRARFLSAGVVILGLGSVWTGRWLATVEWFPAQD